MAYPHVSILHKMNVNKQKYPAKACAANKEIQKYTNYSDESGIKKDENKLLATECYFDNMKTPFELKMPFVHEYLYLSEDISEFARDRHWCQKYTLPNICLAMISEVGELCDAISWKEDHISVNLISKNERDKICQETADICIFFVPMARVMNLSDLFCF